MTLPLSPPAHKSHKPFQKKAYQEAPAVPRWAPRPAPPLLFLPPPVSRSQYWRKPPLPPYNPYPPVYGRWYRTYWHTAPAILPPHNCAGRAPPPPDASCRKHPGALPAQVLPPAASYPFRRLKLLSFSSSLLHRFLIYFCSIFF